MDNFSFASLAYVRVLLLPVGLIPQASFESYAAEIRSFESIRLSEIPADTKDGKGIWNTTQDSFGILIHDIQLLDFCLTHCQLATCISASLLIRLLSRTLSFLYFDPLTSLSRL